ncbi:MAG: hypothetical protein K6F50_08670 [Kiritimatiellae bacterium]|nr:hypothetical protein [Kiritimatiellia bacterium]
MKRCRCKSEIWNLILEQEASGKSKADFAAERGIPASTFFYYAAHKSRYDPINIKPKSQGKRYHGRPLPRVRTWGDRLTIHERRCLAVGILLHESEMARLYYSRPFTVSAGAFALAEYGLYPSKKTIAGMLVGLGVLPAQGKEHENGKVSNA